MQFVLFNLAFIFNLPKYMKRKTLLLIFLFLFLCLIIILNKEIKTSSNDTQITTQITNTTKLENSIFKVISYKNNKKFNLYDIYSIWSSVLINNNELLTNVHVILDDNQNILDNLIICYNEDSSVSPDCKYTATVKNIDKNNDLAILSISPKDINWAEASFTWWVKLSESQLSLQDDIYMYGYPVIWWDTITYTKWKVSWFSNNWDIKTDAKIDAWSSWWWAFKSNELVWITTYIISDNDTIWYIKPINEIKRFINNRNNFSTQTKITDDFLKYYKKIYNYIGGKWVYENNWFKLTWIPDDFSINKVSYSDLTDYIYFSWNNSNDWIDVIVYWWYIFNKKNLTNLELIDWVNNFLYKNYTKVCDNINTLQEKNNFKCVIYKNWIDQDYNRYLWYVINWNRIYVTVILSEVSNWKDEDYLKDLFSHLSINMSYYYDSKNVPTCSMRYGYF